VKYGWPKNLLRWREIQQSCVDLAATVPIHFVIADPILCMEGTELNRWLEFPVGWVELSSPMIRHPPPFGQE
jgi:hypothetical protein